MADQVLIPDVTGLDMAFGTVNGLPAYADVPDEFKRHNGTRWNEMFNRWFYSGLSGLSVIPRDGVDPDKALRHIKALMGSFEPKHEHKEAGCAYLMSRYFQSATWDGGSAA
jgi:hypothetical protein